MADSRFFQVGGPFTAGALVQELGCELSPGADPDLLLTDVGALSDADHATLTFLANRRYADSLANTSAGAVLLEPGFVDRLPPGCVGLISKKPYYDFALASQMFYPEPVPEPGIHPSAVIDDSATIGDRVRIDAGVVVGRDVKLGDGVWLAANAVIEAGVTIGEATWIGAGAFVSCADIGAHCRILSGARIGTRGFGFAMDPRGHRDIPQLGTVQIGNFVEIGANTAIDRGMGPDTIIGDGSKIDNLVQIGHNVQLGRGCVIAGQAGIAGSTVLKDFVACGAQSGLSGHLTVGPGAQVAAKAGVLRDIEPGGKVGGLPAVPIRQWFRQQLVLEKAIQKPGGLDSKEESSNE